MSMKRINNFLGERHSRKSIVDIRYAFDSDSMMLEKKLKLQEMVRENPGVLGFRYELAFLKLAIASRELNKTKPSKPEHLLQALSELQLAHLAFVDLIRDGERAGYDVSTYRKRVRQCRRLLPKAIDRVEQTKTRARCDALIGDFVQYVRRNFM